MQDFLCPPVYWVRKQKTSKKKGETKIKKEKQIILTLATLRVIKAGGNGHRKSQETPDLLESKEE